MTENIIYIIFLIILICFFFFILRNQNKQHINKNNKLIKKEKKEEEENYTNILITQDYGRLGNNILQLINAFYIYIMEKDKNKILTCNLENIKILIDIKQLEQDINKPQIEKIKKLIYGTFFYDNIDYNIQRDISEKYLIKYLNPNYKNLKKNYGLLIHIRSGDIFNNYTENMKVYTQPPLEYYKKVIEDFLKNNPKQKIKIITERDQGTSKSKNPVISELQKIYPIETNDLIEDIKLILSYKNICISTGTFIPSLLLFSTNIENIYFLDEYVSDSIFNFKNITKNTKIILHEFKLYYPYINEWFNTPEQYIQMITYTGVYKSGKLSGLNTSINEGQQFGLRNILINVNKEKSKIIEYNNVDSVGITEVTNLEEHFSNTVSKKPSVISSLKSGAIVILTRGYPNKKSYDTLIERNKALYNIIKKLRPNLTDYNNFMKKVDILIYHEGNISKSDMEYIKNETNKMPLKFIEFKFNNINTTQLSTQSNNLCQKSNLSEMTPIGYKHMCHFWSIDFLDQLKYYNYILRLDEDCIIKECSNDILNILEGSFMDFKYVYLAKFQGPDVEDVILGLHDFNKKYLPIDKIDYNRNFDCPYTNVFLMNVQYFINNQLILNYLQDLDQTSCIYINRWGDLPIFGSILYLFVPENLYLKNIDISYYHGSHNIFIQ